MLNLRLNAIFIKRWQCWSVLHMLRSTNRGLCINVREPDGAFSLIALCVWPVDAWNSHRKQACHSYSKHTHTHIDTLRAADRKPNSVFSVFPFQKATNYIYFFPSLSPPPSHTLSLSLIRCPLALTSYLVNVRGSLTLSLSPSLVFLPSALSIFLLFLFHSCRSRCTPKSSWPDER